MENIIQSLQFYYPRDWRTRRVEPFAFPFVWNTLGASAAQSPAQATVNSDSDFLVTYAVRVATAADLVTPVTLPPVELQIFDSTGNQYTNGLVHVENIAGTSQLPFEFPIPRLIGALTTITIQATNDSATAIVLRIELHGVRVYNAGSRQQR